MLKTQVAQAPALIGQGGDSLREAFGLALVKYADQCPKMVVLDADVAGGTGAHHFRKAHPDRFYQFGIAEQNMMAAAGGMAATGLIPCVTTFAVFCLRAYEQARLSIAYTNRNVKIIASHPGLDVGPDGGSAQSLEDLAAFRALPNITVISPADSIEMDLATLAVLEHVGPVYMRTGRSPTRQIFDQNHVFKIGKGQVLAEGSDVTIIACGVQVARSLDAAKILAEEGLSARVINMHTIKPIDKELIIESSHKTGCFVTSEDHNILGGLGSAVSEVLSANHPCPVEFNGVHDKFGTSGDPKALAEAYGLSAPSIAEDARKSIGRKRK